MRIRASGRRWLAVLLAAGLVGVPAVASGAPAVASGAPAVASGAPADDLAGSRAQLADAGRELEEISAAVRQVGDEVAAAEERLRAATTSLADVRSELEEAQRAAATAAATEREAAADLEDAVDLLAQLGDLHRGSRDRLEAQAVTAYKRGGDRSTDLLFTGVVRSGDLHEVAVAREVLARLLVEQRRTLEDDLELTLAAADASSTVGDARRRAVDAARVAATEQRRVAELVVSQERLVSDVEEEAATRRAALGRLEADAAARAVLVGELEVRVAALELAATSVRVPVRLDLDLDLDGPAPAWAVGLPPAARPWAATVDAVAAREGIDGRLLAALVWTESNFVPTAVSHAGAYGMAQLMPGTARGLGVDPRDPVQNLTGGARYLATQLDAFGSVELALAAYNAGPGRVRGAGNTIPDIVETQLYVVRVLDRYRALSEL